MHPHHYTVDSFSTSLHLADTILASSTPSQISNSCASIAHFLHSHTPDQSRHFFCHTFPALIRKLFGFDDAVSPPSSWLDVVLHSNDVELASRVFNLFSPTGVLLQLISAVDRQSLVTYAFPIERLPEWARLLPSNDKHYEVLNKFFSMFRDKIKEDLIKGNFSYQVRLNVFEYFIFWFAYYPICKGNYENSHSVSTKRDKKFRLENWACSIRGFPYARQGHERKFEFDVYMRLLYAYLHAFVPIFDLSSHQPYCGSLLHFGHGNDGAVLRRAEFVVDTLVNYWLVDNDFSPLPVGVCKSFELSFPLRSVLGETPPTPNLGAVVDLLVKYLNLSMIAGKDGGDHVESPKVGLGFYSSFDGKSRDMVGVGSWNSSIQRPVYRFILRTFLFCPVGTSMKNALQVFTVWVSYMEPWKIGLDDFVELDAGVDGKDAKKEDVKSKKCGYSSLWQGYVLSNYLYYSSLVMHFIGFAHKFLHTDPEGILHMVLKVVEMLTLSKDLTDLIKTVDTVFHSKQVGSGKSVLDSLYRYVPLIREQLQDWEDGLCESDADGSFLHENWNKDLRLFADGEDGGQQLLQLFILRAEAELQAHFGDNLAKNLQCIDSLKKHTNCLFGGHTVKLSSFAPQTKQCELFRDEIFKPRRIGNKAWADVKYKGDWMKRPISDDEVAWLAKFLIRFSSWLNENLGLNQPEPGDLVRKWSYVDISSDLGNVCGPAETFKTLLFATGSWFLMLTMTLVGLMRKHGLRVNLRMFASKKIVMVLIVYALFSILKRALDLFYSRV